LSSSRIFLLAQVVSNRDPKGLGRIKVKKVGYQEQPGRGEEGEWIRMASPAAGKEMGMVWLPEIGQEVLVCTDGAAGEMLMMGSLYNGEELPPYQNEDGENHRKMLRTRSGNEIVFSDENGQEIVEIRTAGSRLEIRLENGGPVLTINSEDRIRVRARGDLDVRGRNVRITGEQTLVLKAPHIELNN